MLRLIGYIIVFLLSPPMGILSLIFSDIVDRPGAYILGMFLTIAYYIGLMALFCPECILK